MSVAQVLPHPLARIVIVEDEGILALDLSRHLTSLGYDVRGVAGDCEAALSLIERERPELVLMDIRIQGEFDGVETVTKLRTRLDVPVVYLTAHSDPKTIERAQQTEPMGYLLKPFKKADLQNVVAIALARSQLERALRRREEALRTTLDCMAEGIITTDLNGRVASLNPAAAKLVGTSVDQAQQRPLGEVISLRTSDGAPLVPSPVDVSLEKGRHEFEARLDTSSGARTVVGTAASIRSKGTSVGVVLALRDLTELLAARRQLEFSERLSSLGTLAAGVAHEVNNPLTVVLANVSFALTTQMEKDAHEALIEAEDAAKRVAHLINDLRSFSKPQPETLSLLDPRQVVMQALMMTRSSWRSVASVDLELGPVPLIAAAPMRLVQVLVNLLINASQAMEGVGGKAHRLVVSSHTDASGRAVLTVRDTGPGVPDMLRERIFEPFFTTKSPNRGTGLGLAVSRTIIENHGGTLSMQTGDDGTTFAAAFPPGGPTAPAAVPTVVWIGNANDTSRALQLTPVPPMAAAVRAALATKHDLVLLALEAGDAHSLCDALPELETALRVSNEPQPAGAIRLHPPFDMHALAALVRPVEPRR